MNLTVTKLLNYNQFEKYPLVTALIEQRTANGLARQVNWLTSSRLESTVRGIFEQTTVLNNSVIIKYIIILILKEHLSFNLFISD